MVLSRLFGKKDPLARVRKAYDDQRWADCLRMADSLKPESIGGEQAQDLVRMLDTAGDNLCRLNLEEGDACLRAGDHPKAREHFQLALNQARSEDLRHKAEGLLAGAESDEVVETVGEASGCANGSCGIAAGSSTDSGSDQQLDENSHLELILSSYPPTLVQRYLEKSSPFRDAFLAAHDGRDQEAFDGFDQVAESEQDDLFFFERGLVRDRLGDATGAMKDLEKAFSLNEAHAPALEGLIALHWRYDNLTEVEKLARKGTEIGISVGFCLGRLAGLRLRQGQLDEALDFGRQAMSQGPVDRETVMVVATLLEKTGQIDEAEAVLGALSTKGCGGGGKASPYLAEFWLRHGRNLDKAIDAFNQAARGEPGNPRWIFRVGEAYMAKGWKKEGRALLERAVAHPSLEDDLTTRARQYLED